MTNALQILAEHIKRFVRTDIDVISFLEKRGEIRQVKNKEYLLTEGTVCREKYFIVKGCLRKYINTEDGDKQTFQFCIENWWMTDYTSLESGNASNCNIQAVEDSTLIVINKENLELLFQELPPIETYFRKVLQRAYEASLTRIHLIFTFSGEQRYRRFAEAFPDFIQRIPQYMLASYLGFTPEFLSKVRSRKR